MVYQNSLWLLFLTVQNRKHFTFGLMLSGLYDINGISALGSFRYPHYVYSLFNGWFPRNGLATLR